MTSIHATRLLRRPLAVAALLAVLVPTPIRASGATPGAGSKPTIALTPCTLGVVRARCGWLSVPENPQAPTGRHIRLRVAVVPARSAHPRPDPLFYFSGWGGVAVGGDLPYFVPLLARVNQDRDLVFVDRRGSGESNPLWCAVPSTAELAKGGPAVITAYARRCLAQNGSRMPFYTTPIAAGDYDLVRRALGYERINLYGASYGPTMEQVYLRQYGAHVRTATLDSGSLLDVHIFEQAGPNAQHALDLVFQHCAADAACHAAFPQLRQDFARVMARLTRGPTVVTQPALAMDRNTFRDAFESVVDNLLAFNGAAQLPRLIHHAAQGDFAPVAQIIRASGEPTQAYAWMPMIECSEPWAFNRPAEVARLSAGSFYRDALLRSAQVMQAVCHVLPPAPVPADLGQRVRSTVPVLLLNGEADPADPPMNVANARRELPHSLTVIVSGQQGHGQIGHGCVDALIARFIGAGTARGLDASCAQRIPLAAFDTHS